VVGGFFGGSDVGGGRVTRCSYDERLMGNSLDSRRDCVSESVLFLDCYSSIYLVENGSFNSYHTALGIDRFHC